MPIKFWKNSANQDHWYFRMQMATPFLKEQMLKMQRPRRRKTLRLRIKEYVVALQLTKEGTTKFAEATAANVGKQISIIYDGQTISSPRVNQAIEGGEAVITGMSSYEEADNLAATIESVDFLWNWKNFALM